MKSCIDPQTIQAYLETHYRVSGNSPFTLRVGSPNEALRATHRLHQVDSSAFVTACNPLGAAHSDRQNAELLVQLEAELRARRLTFLPGKGEHPTNGWPAEHSYLVFGITMEQATALCRQFAQNAFVWCGADATPQLILLR